MSVRHGFCHECSREAAPIFALLCVMSAACSPSPRTARPPEASRPTPEAVAPRALDVQIMSFNTRYGSARDGANSWWNRREPVFRTIREAAPDVVGLQEALRFQIDEIRRALPGYGEVGVGRDGGTAGEYSAILYRTERLDIDESGTFWLSDTPRGAVAALGERVRAHLHVGAPCR